MKVALLSGMLLLGLAASGLSSQAGLLSPGYRECLKNADQNVGKINQCQKKEYDRLDGELSSVYKALTDSLDAPDKGRLKEAQAAWEKALDADVKFLALKHRSGLTGALAGAEYRLSEIARRTSFLKAELAAGGAAE